VREVFSRDIFGLSVSAVSERLSRESAPQPPAVASDRDVLAYVRLKPGAIGYVSAGADVQGVKVVGLGKAAAGPQPIPIGNMPPPEKIVDASAVYPVVARTARVQGSVDLMVVVGANGNVEQARVLHSVPLLDDAAIAAVKKWKYKPTIVNGVAVPISMMVRITFQL
jgi:protein TonB